MACAPVAQLDRAPDYESGGREFESLRARHSLLRYTTINGCKSDCYGRTAVRQCSPCYDDMRRVSIPRRCYSVARMAMGCYAGVEIRLWVKR